MKLRLEPGYYEALLVLDRQEVCGSVCSWGLTADLGFVRHGYRVLRYLPVPEPIRCERVWVAPNDCTYVR
jgi:hypothetical protein